MVDYGITKICILACTIYSCHHMCGSRGGTGVRVPLKNHKLIGFPSNTGPDPLKTSKLPSQHSTVGHWHFAGSPIIARFWWSLEPHSPKKNLIRVEPPLTILSGSAHAPQLWCKQLHWDSFYLSLWIKQACTWPETKSLLLREATMSPKLLP